MTCDRKQIMIRSEHTSYEAAICHYRLSPSIRHEMYLIPFIYAFFAGKPYFVGQVNVTRIDENSGYLSWSISGKGRNDIENQEIQYYKAESVKDKKILTLEANKRSYNLDKLQSNTSYIVRLSAMYQSFTINSKEIYFSTKTGCKYYRHANFDVQFSPQKKTAYIFK